MFVETITQMVISLNPKPQPKPQYKPPNTKILVIGTPKMVPLTLGNPKSQLPGSYSGWRFEAQVAKALVYGSAGKDKYRSLNPPSTKPLTKA